jgi:hypothetical protein
VLRLKVSPRRGGRKVVMEYLGIPAEFVDGADKGWYEFYWEPMKGYFG